jgi:large subunit ribosomal protein L13
MEPTRETIVAIDASGKSFGRLASEVAVKLRGKDAPAFSRHALTGPRVRVLNLRRVRFTGKKLSKKVVYRHTGYIGHLRKEKFAALWARKPAEVFRRTVAGMLPRNKLRPRMLKRLEIEL